MAIKWASANWKTDLKTRVYQTERIYLDFRQEIYPPYNSDLEYTLITSGANQPGGFNVTGGTSDYILELTDPITVRARVYPNFAYDVATDQPIWGWYIDGNNYLTLYYEASNDRYEVEWKNGGTRRILNGPTYTDNSHQAWTDLDVVIDFANSQAALYIDRSAVDTSWNGAPDAKGSNFPIFYVLHRSTDEGDYQLNHIRVFPSLEATATQVGNDYKAVKNEEIIWHFNGEGCGRTRCNVTRFVQSVYNEKSIEGFAAGSPGANKLRVEFISTGGELADDQYAAFDPTSDAFNGLVTQKYMQNRCRLEMESWYDHDYEVVFTGRLDEDRFSRTSFSGNLQTVTVTAEDAVSDIARKYKRSGITYENKDISSATEADSLLHLITRLATKEDIYNFLANSSFENATIGNSWILAGTSSSKALTREAGGLFGSYEAQLVNGDAPNYAQAIQTITFTGIKKLNVGETWTFSIYLKSTDACSYGIYIYESDSVGINDSSYEIYTLSGGEGWDLWSVSHTITDSDSDRLSCYIYVNDNVTLSMDGAMLIQNDRALNWFILNDNDGAAGVESADDADFDSYDTVGFDADVVAVTHPWVLLSQGTNVWDTLQELGDAAGAMYNGMDEAGVYKFRAKLKTGYTDPSSLETITDSEIQGVGTTLEVGQANKITVHGIKIKKYTNIVTLWNAAAAGSFAKGTGEVIAETVANGEYWPDDVVESETSEARGETWAKYGQV